MEYFTSHQVARCVTSGLNDNISAQPLTQIVMLNKRNEKHKPTSFSVLSPQEYK